MVVLLWIGLLLASDVRAADRSLAAAADRLQEVRAGIAAGELDRAAQDAAEAQTRAGQAARRVDGPLWWAAARVPVLGRSVSAAQDLTALAVAAAEVAGQAVEEAGPFLAGDVDPFAAERQVDLDVIEDARAGLAAIDLAVLQAAVDDVAAIDPARIHSRLAVARERALDVSRGALATAERASSALEVMPAFLGADGPRTYVLAMQNPSELRGTGGLISEFAFLTADGGRLALSETEHGGSSIERLLHPEERYREVDASDEFKARYDHVQGRGFLDSVNLDPDLPTVAPILLDLIADRTGRTDLDGAIFIDVLGTQALLEGAGVTTIPAPVPVPGLPDPIPVERLDEVLLIEVYDVFGVARSTERKAWAEALIGQVFDRMVSGGGDLKAQMRALGDAAGRRHLQLYSVDPDEQAVWEDLGIAGALPRAGSGVDLLAVTASNANADKKDVHLGHRITATLELSDVRVGSDSVTAIRSGTIEVEVVNPLGTTGHDTYILGGAEPRTIFSVDPPPREDVAPSRTWFTLWTHESTGVTQIREGGEPISLASGTIHGHRAFDHVLEVTPESEASFEMDVTGPVTLERRPSRLVYRLLLWRQSKAIPDVWDLTLRAPEGYEIVDAGLEGGGDGTGMGVLGDAGKPSLLRSPGEVRVTGGLTRDATLVVRLEAVGD